MNKMKLRHKTFKLLDDTNSRIPSGNISFIIAFIIPLIILVALYYIRNFFPFGSNCYLRSDMYHQYAPFFSELWHKLRTGDSLSYSWDVGMGTNFLSLYAYYLASPVNWLIVLFPQKCMIEIMNTLIILKIAGSSVTLTYYISRHFSTKKCTIALFGIFYALSAYVAAYSWNIMWLDCILLLPLIMLGLECLVKDNKGFLYCISLGLCIFTNYYISIMVCLSVILYFIVLIIAYDGVRKPVIYFKKFINWCIYSLLAGGLAAILLLPELYTFSLSASSSIDFPKTMTVYFSVMEMLVRQLINVPVHLGLEHYPNIYCGVAVFLLVPLYVMNKHVNSREKIGKCIILLFFLISYNINILNFIWHGFHYPNSLPCRQSFIYIFFLVTMSYEAFHHLRALNRRQFASGVWIALGFLVLAEQLFKGSQLYKTKIFYISGAFILIYALILYLHQKTQWKVPVLLFVAFSTSIVELTINMESTGLGSTSRTAYLLDYDAVDAVTDMVSAQDASFYRMDKIYGARSKNDGAWHNYHTISTFSSTSSKGMSDLFGMLGIEHSINSYGYDGSTMVTNALFSVKYLISNKHMTESPLLNYYTGADGEFIYQNAYTLPIGYGVPANLDALWTPGSSYNGIENQNSLIRALTGIKNVFTLNYSYRAESDVTFSPAESGHMYAVLQQSTVKCDTVGISVNGTVTNYSGLENGNHILDIGYVTTADTIEIYAESPMTLAVYTLDTGLFTNAYKQLAANGLNVTQWSSTKITGTATVDEDGIFLFSIPYDAGWNVYIDGKKVSTYTVADALLAADISAGEHTITLKYIPVNLIKGCIITFVCIMILIAIGLFHRCRRLGKINTSNLPLLLQEFISEQDIVLNRAKKTIMTQDDIELLFHSDMDDNFLSDDTDTPINTNIDMLDDFDNIVLEDYPADNSENSVESNPENGQKNNPENNE